ncbi:hypothetical protein DS901_13865 [Loktanella sp. D2R18]|uniref:hypothetical protein n=1 Tax=Rhodobacterales TaxID=204455 RepID=UPI000DE8A3DD|nr:MULTISPECIES: hypothetical protein [Rhodobacterales]MDO6588938.1 hypothetical protein [Yoonia sp. 1_MG-2023]RBW41843.1 hypothetical protein DS901_13865 [Loktanella sp. D2R18]
MNAAHRPARTTHTTQADTRLGWARSILADIEVHSDARIRRACKTILTHSRDHAERQLATDLLTMLAASATEDK